MSGKMTAEQLDIMRKRKILLNERLCSVNKLITGRGVSLAGFINGEDGKPSEEKINDFISELIDCHKRSRKLDGRGALSENTEEMYRAFLYLAVQGLVDRRIRKTSDFSVVTAAESFADVIGAAEELEPCGLGDYRDFLIAELDSFIRRYSLCDVGRNMPVYGTFGMLMYVMSDCMEGFTLYDLPRPKLLLLCKEYAERFDLSNGKMNILMENVFDQVYGDPSQDGYDEYTAGLAAADEAERKKWYEEDVSEGKFTGTFEEYLEHIGPDLDEFIKELDERDAIAEAVSALGEEESYKNSEKLRGYSDEEIEERLERKLSDESWDNTMKWLDALPSAERYCATYKKFAELYFEIGHSELVSDITEMIDVFLFERRLSAFSFGDDYLMMNYHFDKFKERVEYELVRGRKK